MMLMLPAADEDRLQPASAYPSTGRAWYAVGVLMVLYIFSYIDRTILTLLVEPIRRDLAISDTQISLLHGLAFALFYTLLGLPLGRLADSRHRIGLISIGVFVWSVMTALCGLAKGFWQLFAARMGVGVGEAALSPAAYSIITDYFPPHKLSRALSTYVMGTYLGMGCAYVIGGGVVSLLSDMAPPILPLVGMIYPWQVAFFIVGLPGLLLCLLVWTVREPQRQGTLRRLGMMVKSVPLADVLRFIILHKRTYIAHFLGFGLLCLLINGIALWTPTFLARSHGLTLGEAGVTYGVMIALFGGGGIIAGGWFADHLQQRGIRGASFVAAITGAGCAVLPTVAMPLMPTATGALVLMAPALFFGSFPFGLGVAAIQQITPNQMRGQVSAIYLFFSNLLGIGTGPVLVALVTDYVFGDDMALAWSMAIVGGLSALAATFILAWGLRPFQASLEAADDWNRVEGA